MEKLVTSCKTADLRIFTLRSPPGQGKFQPCFAAAAFSALKLKMRQFVQIVNKRAKELGFPGVASTHPDPNSIDAKILASEANVEWRPTRPTEVFMAPESRASP